jgi:hypothetical protein
MVGFMGYMSPLLAGLGWLLTALLNVGTILKYIDRVSDDGKNVSGG